MRVTVQSRRDGGVDIGTPEVFAAFNFFIRGPRSGFPWGGFIYDVTPDGKRLLVIARTSGVESAGAGQHINLVINWFEELKRLVPMED